LNKVTGSGTDRLPLAPFQVSLVNKTQPRHELGSLGKKDTYPAKVKADHTLADQIAATDTICSPVSVFDSKYSSEVYMVEQGGEPLKKTAKEIQQEAEEEIPRAERLARELDKRKGHNSLQDDSGGSEDEHPDRAPIRRHHPKFNSQHNVDRDRL
jgi:hypothetical protein